MVGIGGGVPTPPEYNDSRLGDVSPQRLVNLEVLYKYDHGKNWDGSGPFWNVHTAPPFPPPSKKGMIDPSISTAYCSYSTLPASSRATEALPVAPAYIPVLPTLRATSG